MEKAKQGWEITKKSEEWEQLEVKNQTREN